ncbi:MAG: hypothetical protein ACYC1E_12170 [Propionibacteriaceae bacterium]
MSDRSPDRRLRLVEDVVEVCLDSAEENLVSAMALRATALLDSSWNGWARPVATATATRDFLNRWRRNDPNGTWGDAIEADGQLLCTNSDGDDPDVFLRVGTTRSGEPLYDLTGWMWVAIDSTDLEE